MKITPFWFRRDLRLSDNAGLSRALAEAENVQPLFIFDPEILTRLQDPHDARVHFLHETISDLRLQLSQHGVDLWVLHGKPQDVWEKILKEYEVTSVYVNEDYEPDARKRDDSIAKLLKASGAVLKSFKDQVLFAKDEILTGDERPYTVYTPYKKKVLATLSESHLKAHPVSLEKKTWHRGGSKTAMPSLKELGFLPSKIEWPKASVLPSIIETYDKTRDFPAHKKGTTHLGLHLRFGTLSVRSLAAQGQKLNDVWLSELIWRDFFMQVLWHHPRVQNESFRPAYDQIAWRTSKSDFERWCEGTTGYPMVDAGMRELNQTGYMHNRVRMVVASFLTKHLLIYWLQGERYFAEKLLDYDLSANNGNWQWAAGTGCDAAPYFRVFNPEAQAKKFDPKQEYIRHWVPEIGTSKYPQPIVAHEFGRGRALQEFTKALKGAKS